MRKSNNKLSQNFARIDGVLGLRLISKLLATIDDHDGSNAANFAISVLFGRQVKIMIISGSYELQEYVFFTITSEVKRDLA